jgi:hypothetical protein
MSSAQDENPTVDHDGNHAIGEPGDVLPSQLYDPSPPDGPERRLIVAMLADALRCVQQYRAVPDTDKRTLYNDARRWICSRDRSWCFSFENVCLMLDLDPDSMRNAVTADENAPARESARPSTSAAGEPSPAAERARRR